MSKWKSWIGVILILASVAGLIFWEVQGRKVFLTERVLVAAQEIPAGSVVTGGSFTVASVPAENLVEGALSAEAAASLAGSCVKETIPGNQQIVPSYFIGSDLMLSGGESFYVLPEEWIVMRSSSLRKGDDIELYGATSFQKIGGYRVAFVKDQGEQEVAELEGGLKTEALSRTNSTAQISHIEIVTNLTEYGQIRQAAFQEQGLLVVQRPASGGEGA